MDSLDPRREPAPDTGSTPPSGSAAASDSASGGSTPSAGPTPPSGPTGPIPPHGATPPHGPPPPFAGGPTPGAAPWGNAGSGWSWNRGRTLSRTRQGKLVAGVCAGLGRTTGVDPILFRVILTVLVFFGGVGALVYLVAWVALPIDDEPASPVESLLGRGRSSTSPPATVGLLVVAALLLMGSFANGFQSTLLLAACLIGGMMLLRRAGQHHGGYPASAGPPPHATLGYGAPSDAWAPGAPTPGTPPAPPTAPDTTTTGASHTPAPSTGAPFAATPYGPGPYPAGSYNTPGQPYTQPFAPYGPYAPVSGPGVVPPVPPMGSPGKRPKERSVLGRLTLSIGCLAIVVLLIVNAADVHIPFTGFVALALGIVAAGLFVGVWAGRARWLIPIGLVLAVALGIGSIAENADGGPNTDRRDVNFVPTTLAEVRPSYELGAGDFELDLRGVDFSGITRTIKVDTGLGDTKVVLDRDVDVTVKYDLGAGDAKILEDRQEGLGVSDTATDYGANGADTSDLTLVINHGAGDLEVSR